MLHAGSDTRHDAQVEVDDVPSREDVRVDLGHAAAKCRQRRSFVDTRDRVFGHLAAAGIDDVDLVEVAAVQRNRQQSACLGIGLYIERQDPGLDLYFRWRDLRIVEYPVDAFAALGTPVNFETAPDVVIDEEAHGETDIRLERVDALGVQPVTQDGRVGGRLDIDARDARAGERSSRRGALMRRADLARPRRIRRRHVEARGPAVIAHEEGLALFQTTEQVHDGYTVANPVARLHYEAPYSHVRRRLRATFMRQY